MKLFLIKAGKAFAALRRDGLARGSRKIWTAFWKMFGRVGSGDVLFITGGVGDSARYRAYHVAEELETRGLKCSITVQDNPLLSRYAGKFKIFIFHRVLFTSSVKKLVENAKKQNKEIIFETDDLVFDPRYLPHMDYFQKMNFFEKKLYENGVGGEILRDPYVKVCTTTTAYLADKLKEYGKRVFIVSNKLSNKDLETIEKTRNLKLVQNSIRIGYFSGTISHNRDFATIADALVKIMEKYPRAELFLAGPLEIGENLIRFKNRIKKIPYVSREEHFKNIASVDINLAPLEAGNPFCEAKSELKFFEAGIVGVPTVAVGNRTFSEAIEDGLDGFLAGTEEEWTEKLSKLIEDGELRKKMGANAREKSLRNYTNKSSRNEEYYNYLRSKL